MFELDEKTIRNWVDEITIIKARQYYKGDYVEELKIKLDNPSHSKIGNTEMIINGRVNSFNDFNSYDVKIHWDGISNKLKAYCTCFDNNNDTEDGPCRHITAVLLKYINEYQDKSYGSQPISEIDNLIESLKQASGENQEFKRELNLEIKFYNAQTYYRPYIEMKVGLEKSYVVKSTRRFLEAVLDGESLEFGKNFTYDPSIHKFNETDEKIIEMFSELRELDGEHKSGYYNYYDPYNNSIFSGKKLSLTDAVMYRFFKLAKDRNIDAVIDGHEYTDVMIFQSEIPMKFRMNMNKQNIELLQEGEMPEHVDSHSRIFFYDGNFYLPPEKQINMYKPIYNLIKNRNNKKIIISKNDGEKVASYLLPALKKVSDEVTLDENLKDAFYQTELIIRVYLDKRDDFVTASLIYKYDDIEIGPFSKNTAKQDRGILIRDIEKEENCDSVLRSFGFEKDKDCYIMKNEASIVSFIDQGVNKLQELGEVYYSESFKNIRLYGKSSMKAGIRINNENYLEFSFELEGVDKDELASIFSALKQKKKYYRLKEGGFVSLEDDGIKDMGEIVDYLGIDDKELSNDKILLSKFNALYLDQKIKDRDMDYVKRSSSFRELANNVHDAKDMDYDLPEHLDKVMRNYQKTGFKWFKTLSRYGFGGILADEMGLGKTLQTIAFLDSEKGEKPSMVVVPTSLLYNWQSEIEKFAPELKAIVISGAKRERERLISKINESDVVITSYPLIRRDIYEYGDIDFKYCILDEAQQIKNAASINASTVKKIKAQGYFALTGTPMENSLTELWSIFDFIMPGYLFSHSKFSRMYEIPIAKSGDKTALDELERHIKPFILRRLKKDVIKELPSKIEHKLVVEMTDEQKKLYAAFSNSAKKEINEEIRENGFNKSKIKIFSILTRLRQICCDPSVFVENYRGESGKMLALSDLLDESINQGHRVLLFSQFTSVLKNIVKILDKNKMNYFYLDGSTKSEDRMSMCSEFNSGKGDRNIFLISLKAGGTGLNLTGADTVIHFDPWWNPAVEEQATDRAHRIGQKKTVEVIKLLSKGTIEEKIFNLQEKKKKMINSVINEDMNEDNVMTKMTQEDLESLFI